MKRQAVVHVMNEEHGTLVKQACCAVDLSRAAHCRKPVDGSAPDSEVIEALKGKVERHGR